MKRLVMTKYGFERDAANDFSDDGNRFTCFRVGNVGVTKHISNGQVYLSGSVEKDTLTYEEYSKCHHFNDVNWLYNGVSLEKLTDEDMFNFFEACLKYDAEYAAAEATIAYPSLEELTKAVEKINEVREKEFETACELCKAKVIDLMLKNSSSLVLNEISEMLQSLDQRRKALDVDTYPAQIQYTRIGKNLIKNFEEAIKPSFYYRRVVELMGC